MCDLQYQLVHYDHTTGAITNASSWFPLNEESINVDGWDGVHFREKPRRSAEEIVAKPVSYTHLTLPTIYSV